MPVLPHLSIRHWLLYWYCYSKRAFMVSQRESVPSSFEPILLSFLKALWSLSRVKCRLSLSNITATDSFSVISIHQTPGYVCDQFPSYRFCVWGLTISIFIPQINGKNVARYIRPTDWIFVKTLAGAGHVQLGFAWRQECCWYDKSLHWIPPIAGTFVPIPALKKQWHGEVKCCCKAKCGAITESIHPSWWQTNVFSGHRLGSEETFISIVRSTHWLHL